MTVKLDSDGILHLDEILTKQFLDKACSYSLYKSESGIRIRFYGVDGKPLKAKLRGKAKKVC